MMKTWMKEEVQHVRSVNKKDRTMGGMVMGIRKGLIGKKNDGNKLNENKEGIMEEEIWRVGETEELER